MDDREKIIQKFRDMPPDRQQRLFDELEKVFSKLQTDWESKPGNAGKTPNYTALWNKYINDKECE
jgi:hypothetical protein